MKPIITLFFLLTSLLTTFARDIVSLTDVRVPTPASQWELSSDSGVKSLLRLSHLRWEQLPFAAPITLKDGKLYAPLSGGIPSSPDDIKAIMPADMYSGIINSLRGRIAFIPKTEWAPQIIVDQGYNAYFIYFQEIMLLELIDNGKVTSLPIATNALASISCTITP